MGPTQFVTQCVTIREGTIEKPHVPQIRGVEAPPKFASQPLRQPGQEFRAVLGPVCRESDPDGVLAAIYAAYDGLVLLSTPTAESSHKVMDRGSGILEHPSPFTGTTIPGSRATPVLSSAIHDGRDMTEHR